MKKNYSFMMLTLAVFICTVSTRAQVISQTYNFTGSVQTLTVPSCVSSISFQVTGAQGGTYSPGGNPGLGGLVTGVITVTAGQVLNIYVGGQNGYNGGGLGGVNGSTINAGPPTGFAANGGGASDIRTGGIALTDRIVVAGGGGGASANGVWAGCQVAGPAGNGGNGGGVIGANGTFGVGNPCNCGGGGGGGGFGGTAIAGGATGAYVGSPACLRVSWGPGQPGVLGIGGNGSTQYHNGTGGGGGGGGGYYGGGSGANGSDTTPGGGGGGGSSFTGLATNTTNVQGIQTGNGQVILTYISGITSFSVSPASTTICSGSPLTLTASGATTYTWSTGSFSSGIVVTPSITSNYTVLGTNTLGCVTGSVINISVNSSPTVVVNGGVICSGNSFTISPSGAVTYTVIGAGFIVSPFVSTSYSVVGTGTNGCVSSNVAISSVTVNATPTITVNSGAICKGNSFTITPGGASTYTISGGSAVVSPTSNVSYTVTGTSSSGCIGSNNAISSVTVNAQPVVTSISSSGIICKGETASLTAGGATNYTWNTAATTTVIAVSPTVTTSYTVNGTDANGCTNSATITQSVNACVGIQALFSDESANIHVYPNPSSGLFAIDLSTGFTSNIVVVDILGKTVYSEELRDGNHPINLSNFNSGLYILKVESNGVVKMVRLIKE